LYIDKEAVLAHAEQDPSNETTSSEVDVEGDCVLAPGSSWRSRVARRGAGSKPAEVAQPVRVRTRRKKKGMPAAEPTLPRAPRTSLGAGVVAPAMFESMGPHS